MRELTTAEVQLVSGGSMSIDAESAMVGGAVAGGASQILRGARIGAVLGPKGALGGAIIAGMSWGMASMYSQFRRS